MAITVLNKVWQHTKATGNELVVLLALADFATEHRVAWPSTETLRNKCRIGSRGTLYRQLLDLQLMGELIIEEKKGPHGTNLYHICTGIPLERVDELREEMGLVSRDKLASDSRPSNSKKAPTNKACEAQQPVPESYNEEVEQVVQVCDPKCTVLDSACTDLSSTSPELVHNPLLTVSKDPSFNQFKGNFDFEIFRKQVKSQMPRNANYLDLFDRANFLGLNTDTDGHLVLVIGCDNEQEEEILQARFSSICNNISSAMLFPNDCQVIFTCAQPVLLPQKKNSIRRLDA